MFFVVYVNVYIGSQKHDQYQLEGEKLCDVLLHHVSSSVWSQIV